MENRTLIIGDELFGEQGEAAHRFAELILCLKANSPIQFSINAPVAQTIPELRSRISTDVIGKKPGRIIFGLGLKDLNKGGTGYRQVFEQYSLFVDEVLNKTLSPVHLLTIPTDMFPAASAELACLNDLIRGIQEKSRISILDFDNYAQLFKEKQVERGKFGRSIYTEDGKPTSLCNTLLALFLQESILKELK